MSEKKAYFDSLSAEVVPKEELLEIFISKFGNEMPISYPSKIKRIGTLFVCHVSEAFGDSLIFYETRYDNVIVGFTVGPKDTDFTIFYRNYGYEVYLFVIAMLENVELYQISHKEEDHFRTIYNWGWLVGQTEKMGRISQILGVNESAWGSNPRNEEHHFFLFAKQFPLLLPADLKSFPKMFEEVVYFTDFVDPNIVGIQELPIEIEYV